MMIAQRTTRMVSPDQMARLSAWNERKPVIAIMGEFSAGKSTLLNMLIGQSILPTQITATKLPPVWLRYGDEAPYRVDKRNVRHPIDLNDLSNVPVKDTRYIRIYVQAEVLESCDLLDTPGISDPNIPMTMWIKTIGYANAALWCTHAGQAWRESERAAWESLPARLRAHSLLLVTRSDKITSEIDKMKIDTRLRRETEALFGGRLFISLTNALRALEGDGDADLWSASGAEGFVEQLAGAIVAINDSRTVSIRRYRIDPSARPQVLPRRVRPGLAGPGQEQREESEATPVVPLRQMRVVASNEGPVGTGIPSARPALLEVTGGEEKPHAPQGLNEVTAEQRSDIVWGDAPPAAAPVVPEADAGHVVPEADAGHTEAVGTALFEDFASDVADEVSDDEPAEDLAGDYSGEEAGYFTEADVPAESMGESTGVTEAAVETGLDGSTEPDLSEQISAEPEAEAAAPEVSAAEDEVYPETVDLPPADFAEEASSAEPVEMYQAVSDFADEPGMDLSGETADEGIPAAEAEEMPAVEAPAEAVPDSASDETPAENAFSTQLPAEDAGTDETADLRSAEDTIEAVLARIDDTPEEQPEMAKPEPIREATGTAAEITASALWKKVLSARHVDSVPAMLQAMTEFVALLDASGFRLPAAEAKAVVAGDYDGSLTFLEYDLACTTQETAAAE